ncbi:MAG: YegS/Rv2252/BmrU family lipid kinase [Tissierellia bacterium]|nr:YegS/Rv2252/BmrU family lipid kinase [Tissierellia bacterium]
MATNRMKKIKFIINPSSGRQTIGLTIAALERELPRDKFYIEKYYTSGRDDTIEESKKASLDESIDLIVCFGGDGTVNQVVQGIHNSKVDTPLAVYPSGTVNDLANFLRIPKDVKRFADLIQNFNIRKMDYGLANEQVFINVAAGGLLTNIAIDVSDEMKSILGRSAYYIQGLIEFFKTMLVDRYSLHLKVESKDMNFEGEVMLFIIGNTTSVGGFNKMIPNANVNDGKLDVLIIKECGLNELIGIFLGVLTGSHIRDENVIYFHADEIKMSTNDEILVDLDGEEGGCLPVEFRVMNNSISILS